MIRNDQERAGTLSHIQRFEEALKRSEEPDIQQNVHPTSLKLRQYSFRSTIEELSAEIAEYDALRAGNHHAFVVDSLDDLPEVLVKARIAAGLTEEQLAEKVGIPVEQLDLHEEYDYQDASFTLLQHVAEVLGVRLRAEVTLTNAPAVDQPELVKAAA